MAGLTWVNRAHVSALRHRHVTAPAGGHNRDGAADFVLAGAPRLHLQLLRDETYLVDKATHPGVAGNLTGDEALRRRRTGCTTPAN